MKVYSVYMNGYTSEDAIEVFTSEKLMNKYIKEDMDDVIHILKEDRYEPVIQEKCDYWEIYAKDTDIYYSWQTFESELMEG